MDLVTVSVKDLRDQLADQVNKVAYEKHPVVVTKHGKPVAALVSIEDYEKMVNPRLRFATEQEWDKGFKVIDEIRKLNQKKTSGSVEKLVEKAVTQVRAK